MGFVIITSLSHHQLFEIHSILLMSRAMMHRWHTVSYGAPLFLLLNVTLEHSALLMKSTTNIWWNHWRNNVKSVTFCIFNEVQYWSKSMVKKSTCCVWVSFGAKNQEKLTARLLRNTFRWSANYIRITYPFVFSLQWKQERLFTCEDCDILIAMVIYWHEW